MTSNSKEVKRAYVIFGMSLLWSLGFIFSQKKGDSSLIYHYLYVVGSLFLAAAALSQMRNLQLLIVKLLAVLILLVTYLLVFL